MKIKKIVIGSDHAGYELKEKVKAHLENRGITVFDVGTDSTDSCDYPMFADALCKKIQLGEFERGILVCGTGIGMSIAANKVKGIRASCANDLYSAEMTRRHNNSNVLALGARVISVEKIVEIVDKYISTDFDGSYHQRRLDKIKELEETFNQ